jgi:hypothetical protein
MFEKLNLSLSMVCYAYLTYKVHILKYAIEKKWKKKIVLKLN